MLLDSQLFTLFSSECINLSKLSGIRLHQHYRDPQWPISYLVWHLITGCHIYAGLILTSSNAEGLILIMAIELTFAPLVILLQIIDIMLMLHPF